MLWILYIEEYKDTSDDGEEVSMLKVQTAALPKIYCGSLSINLQKAGIGIDIVDIQSICGKIIWRSQKAYKGF